MTEKSGKCCICGKDIPEKEDGQGSNMVADIELHHPVFPALQTIYRGRWVCHPCVLTIASNVSANDAQF